MQEVLHGDTNNDKRAYKYFGKTRLCISDYEYIANVYNTAPFKSIFIQPYSTNIQYVLVEGNLLESYNYCIGIGNHGSNTYSDFKVKNNRFVKGGFGPVWLNNGVGFAEWTDNYFDDPSDPEHKGQNIASPN